MREGARGTDRPSAAWWAGRGLVVAVGLLAAALALGGTWNPQTNALARLGLVVAMVALGGAVGGIGLYLTDPWRRDGGWRRAVANVFGVLGYLVAVAAGFVLGMNGPN